MGCLRIAFVFAILPIALLVSESLLGNTPWRAPRAPPKSASGVHMSCTVVVLSYNNLTSASGTFTNVYREKCAARSSLALIWYSISSRLNAPPMQILLQTAPHAKLLVSDEISITGSPVNPTFVRSSA